MSERVFLSCTDLKDAGLSDERCCSSCHEDARLGYYPLMDVYSPDGGAVLLVCCRHLDTARRLTEEQWKILKKQKETSGE